jgi:hypothetical protein
MEKKTRKSSKIVSRTYMLIGIVVILFILSLVITFYMAKPKYTINDEIDNYGKEQTNNILFKINDKYINQYGYIINISNSSAIQIQGINIKDNQERLDENSLELLSKLLNLREVLKINDLLDKTSKIDVTDIQNVKVYIDSENKIIQIGNFENLSTKFVYAKNIMKQENGKTGTIFVKDTSKTYFREDV